VSDAPALRRGFRHDDAGRHASEWERADVAECPELSLEGIDQVVVVSAHPDDETLGSAGLIATARGLGVAVAVVVLTAGEGSHPGSPTYPPSRLAGVRRHELVEALGQLGAGVAITLRDYPDGHVDQHVDDVADVVSGSVEPGARRVLLVAPWRGDGHADHESAGVAAATVAASDPRIDLLEYPVWYWHWGDPYSCDAPPLVKLSLSDRAIAQKAAAVAAFSSQTQPLSADSRDAPVLLPRFLEHFQRPFELFVRTDAGSEPDVLTSMHPAYFDAMYARSPDPWGFADRFYETRKRALTMAVLPRARFRSAFEPGCSIGLITEQLAGRCDAVLATDVAGAALEQAAARLAGHSHVRLEQKSIADEWPAGSSDLVVLSEVGYYLAPEHLPVLAMRAAESLTDDGCLVACHWRHPVAEYPTAGDELHAVLRRTRGLAVLAEHVEADFRLDVLVPSPAVSVAAREGLV
jgi:LmbE family N-acetylglucosaminyl deacetylase